MHGGRRRRPGGGPGPRGPGPAGGRSSSGGQSGDLQERRKGRPARYRSAGSRSGRRHRRYGLGSGRPGLGGRPRPWRRPPTAGGKPGQSVGSPRSPRRGLAAGRGCRGTRPGDGANHRPARCDRYGNAQRTDDLFGARGGGRRCAHGPHARHARGDSHRSNPDQPRRRSRLPRGGRGNQRGSRREGPRGTGWSLGQGPGTPHQRDHEHRRSQPPGPSPGRRRQRSPHVRRLRSHHGHDRQRQPRDCRPSGGLRIGRGPGGPQGTVGGGPGHRGGDHHGGEGSHRRPDRLLRLRRGPRHRSCGRRCLSHGRGQGPHGPGHAVGHRHVRRHAVRRGQGILRLQGGNGGRRGGQDGRPGPRRRPRRSRQRHPRRWTT